LPVPRIPFCAGFALLWKVRYGSRGPVWTQCNWTIPKILKLRREKIEGTVKRKYKFAVSYTVCLGSRGALTKVVGSDVHQRLYRPEPIYFVSF
jgi:hypothetical protein